MEIRFECPSLEAWDFFTLNYFALLAEMRYLHGSWVSDVRFVRVCYEGRQQAIDIEDILTGSRHEVVAMLSPGS